ncbi:MAG TPA: hypothetical protein VMM92_15245 [Thermoanaerobaculia bacterium]|nr:hypothetical protein [Thermoanaerobaculia bacterium]
MTRKRMFVIALLVLGACVGWGRAAWAAPATETAVFDGVLATTDVASGTLETRLWSLETGQELAFLRFDPAQKSASWSLSGRAAGLLAIDRLEPAQANDLLYHMWSFDHKNAPAHGPRASSSTPYTSCSGYSCDSWSPGYAVVCYGCVFVNDDCTSNLYYLCFT